MTKATKETIGNHEMLETISAFWWSNKKKSPRNPKLIPIPAAETSKISFRPKRSTIKGVQHDARTCTIPGWSNLF